MITIKIAEKAVLYNLPQKLKPIITKFFSISNPLFARKMELGKSLWGMKSTIDYYEINKIDGSITIPIGGLNDALHILLNNNLTLSDVDIIDNRVVVSDTSYFNKFKFSGTLRDYQQEILKKISGATVGIVESMTGCHSKGTKILMYSGEFKSVEDIKLADKVMGWDSTPREVLKLCNGVGQMYKIIPTRGTSFIVNDEHFLTLKHTTSKIIFDIQVKEFLKLRTYAKGQYKLFRTGVDFEKLKSDLPIDPYFLGVILGDGSVVKNVNITTASLEIENEIYSQAKKFNCEVRKQQGNGCFTYFFTNNKQNNNKLVQNLKNLNLIGTKSGTKFIPNKYKVSSMEDRLNILAGLMDTDGSYHTGTYDYISKSEKLANDVVYIARSVGLRAKVKTSKKSSQSGKIGTYFRVSICGDIQKIPCRLEEKIPKNLTPNKDQLVSGFKIQKLEKDNYYGFIVGGDHRYLFEDFYVTHNSGKTISFIGFIFEKKVNTLILVNTMELVNQTIESLTEFSNLTRDDIGIIGSGKFDIKPITIGIHQTMLKLADDKIALVNKSFGMIIADEVHICAATLYYKTMTKLSMKYKFGFSGTAERADGLDKAIFWATGPMVHKVPRSKLLSSLVIPTYKAIETNYYFPLFDSSDYTFMVSDLAMNNNRNKLIADYVLNNYNTDKHFVCVLCNQVVQVNELARLLGSDARALTSQVKKKDRLEIINDLQNRKVRFIVSTFALFATGINIKQLNVLILAAPKKSKVLLKQSGGRIMRPAIGKTGAEIIDFVDVKIEMLRHQAKVRRKILENL